MKLPRKTGEGQATTSWYLSLQNSCEGFLRPFGGKGISPGFVDESIEVGCEEGGALGGS